jgi:uncharacterized Tic20 family protein
VSTGTIKEEGMTDSRDQMRAPGPQPPPAPDAYGPQQIPVSESDERMWATLGHAGAVLFGFLAPLVVYLVYKDRSEFVRRHASEALNFQILMAAVYAAGIVLTLVLIGPLIMLAGWVVTLIFAIQSAIAANAGQDGRYPVNLGIVK